MTKIGHMRGLLARMQALTQARVGYLAAEGEEGEPGWNPKSFAIEGMQRREVDEDEVNTSGLIECKNALESFRTTHQAPAEAYYAALISATPSWRRSYEEPLAKLHAICALPEKLGSYIARPSVAGVTDIQDTCKSILKEYSRQQYDELFQVCAYFDLRGYQQQPAYGKWKYNGKEYKLIETIQRVQFCVSRD